MKIFNFIKLKNIFRGKLEKERGIIIDNFLSAHYQQHNIARLCHLESLGLDLSKKKVIEFGAGIGDHTFFYLIKNCHVLPTDARSELVEFIKNRYGIEAKLFNAETDLIKINTLGHFDIIHCYGLLYHLRKPAEFIEAVSSIGNTLLLETCVSPDQLPLDIYLTEECKKNPTQAFSGFGCRPSRKWIESELKKHFKNIYYPRTQPKHIEFPVDWRSTPKDGLIRSIFIASHSEIWNPNLTTEMPIIYE